MSLSAAEWTFIAIVGIVLLISVVCNLLVLMVVVVIPTLRNPTNVLICNLAISDLLLASFVLPQNLHDISHTHENYYEGDVLCRVVYACPLLCIMASIYSMAAISFERSQAIMLNSTKKLTFRTAALQLALIWFISILFCVPTLYEHSQFLNDKGDNSSVWMCGSNGVSYAYSVINGVFLFLVAYLVPLVILLVNYGRILWFFRVKGMFDKQVSDRGTVFQVLFKTRMTVVKMLILVAVLFALSWAPYFALLLIEKVKGISDTEHSDGLGNMLKIALSAFSTAYNFALYVAYNRNFRLGMLKLLGCGEHAQCCWRPVQVTPTNEFIVTQMQQGSLSAQQQTTDT